MAGDICDREVVESLVCVCAAFAIGGEVGLNAAAMIPALGSKS